MAYDAQILGEAQELYFAGTSAAKIAAELRRRHPERARRLAEKTVLKWISTPDAFGETWLDKKAKALASAEEKRIDKSADRFGQLTGILDDLIETLGQRLDDAADFKATNPEYTAQVLLQCLTKRAQFLSSAPSDVTEAGEVRLFFEALQEDPELGPVFERRREKLLEAYREKLAGRGAGK